MGLVALVISGRKKTEILNNLAIWTLWTALLLPLIKVCVEMSLLWAPEGLAFPQYLQYGPAKSQPSERRIGGKKATPLIQWVVSSNTVIHGWRNCSLDHNLGPVWALIVHVPVAWPCYATKIPYLKKEWPLGFQVQAFFWLAIDPLNDVMASFVFSRPLQQLFAPQVLQPCSQLSLLQVS